MRLTSRQGIPQLNRCPPVTLRLCQPPTGTLVKDVSGSHTPGGIPFYCQFGTNKLARIDPETLQITEFELSAGARPRRIAFTPDGKLYYTDYARGFLGRLDPATREVREWPSPAGERSQPYGIAATRDGIVWYSESGPRPGTLVRFDPEPETFKSWDIPSGGGVVRHMIATPDGRLFLACSGVNKVGIVTVKDE
ncbi:MAG: hypothetical protein FJW39_34830 [Acidobacteria bacterium]|nr:hypothetical protein [Acidobacteriota bacterium]